jgi:DNA (cytosine-5)-methyltransferase 1
MSKDIVSLFSGCGGLDLGFENVGFDIVFSNDNSSYLKKTYDKNHSNNLKVKDIRNIDPKEIPECCGIIGGPPCQSWSLAGNMDGIEDEKGSLFYDYIKIIKHKKPDFFVAENVPGIISKSNIDEFENILEKFDQIGYETNYKKINSAYYKVPQRRKRVIIVGFRKDLDFSYKFTKRTDKEMTQKDSRITNYNSPKKTKKQPYDIDELSRPNHEYYIGSFSSRYMSRNRVRSWDEPAYTVQANARHQKIHPQAPKMKKVEKDKWKFKEDQKNNYRRYSVREAATLQTFPEDFIFYYDNIKKGYKMIGNAVPVNLSYHIAKSIKNKYD